jgi:pyruvate dehydrogenase E2 component (dihydrolipoamide acetyltransferase)
MIFGNETLPASVAYGSKWETKAMVTRAQQDTGTIVGELDAGRPALSEKSAESAPRRTLQVLPAVRALARKLDVNLNAVYATGPGGTITRADVERDAKSLTAAGPPSAMAQRMAAAHAEVVPATITDDADIDDWRKADDATPG